MKALLTATVLSFALMTPALANVSIGSVAAQKTAKSSVINNGGHKVCYAAQCPGRSRVVCGCPR